MTHAHLGLVLAALTFGCASTMESQSMVPLKKVAIERNHPCAVLLNATGEAEPWIGNATIATEPFQEALATAIEESGLFASVVLGSETVDAATSGAPYQLAVTVVEFEKPEVDIEMRAELVVDWHLTRSEDGELVWKHRQKSSGKADQNEEWDMPARKRLAIERAVQENIESGIERVARLEL